MSSNDMILLIDSGNTRVKFGRLDASEPRRCASTLAVEHAELERALSWIDGQGRRPILAVGVNVAGSEKGENIRSLLERCYGIPLQWISSTARAGNIPNLYEQPSQLGADRWVSLAGLAVHSPGPAVLASFGTATTVDTLSAPDSSGLRRFEGGIILPGVELMRRSLAQGTAGLPYAQGRSVLHPRDTHTAISSGIAAAQAGAVLRQWHAARELLGMAPGLYCTGGGWSMVAHDVSEALQRALTALGLPAASPQWLDAPVLDGLASLAQDQPGVRT